MQLFFLWYFALQRTIIGVELERSDMLRIEAQKDEEGGERNACNLSEQIKF
jgi:hypothetical protein